MSWYVEEEKTMHIPSVLYARRRALFTPAVLAAALLVNPFVRPVAHASIGGCGSDPVVILSTGVSVDLSATIDDDAGDVRQVVYTLHAPVGTGVARWVGTSGPLGPKEVLHFLADTTPGHYDSGTLVSTTTRGVAVSASTLVIPVGTTPRSGSAAGTDQQTLRIHLSV